MTEKASAKATRRDRWAWYMYDFGNSAYAAVVLLAVYSAYFKETVVGGAEGSRLWGLAVGIAMLVVAVTSPILGAIADFSGSKKRFLLSFTAINCIFTALLFLVEKGDVAQGMIFFIIAEIGYRSAQVFYNALLPEIASPEEMGVVSGNGWAIGSAGGILCLLIILPLIVIIGGPTVVRLSLIITAVFFALSTIPLILWLKERAQPTPLPPGENYFSVAIKRLSKTIRTARRFKEFIKFIVAFLIYNDGVIMALDFAAILGAVLFGMNQQELIIFVIVVQITNVLGAYVFGLLANSLGCKKSLIGSLLMMIGIIIWMYYAQSATVFFIIGGLAGVAMAGLQSLSRTLVGMMGPEGQSAEFFGFFAVAGRTSSFIGPAVYGWVAAEAAIMFQARGLTEIAAEHAGLRVAVLSIAVFLLAGLIALLFVHEKRAISAAQSASAEA